MQRSQGLAVGWLPLSNSNPLIVIVIAAINLKPQFRLGEFERIKETNYLAIRTEYLFEETNREEFSQLNIYT
jgi:hypothetical protein